jgi:hypothetical protein
MGCLLAMRTLHPDYGTRLLEIIACKRPLPEKGGQMYGALPRLEDGVSGLWRAFSLG